MRLALAILVLVVAAARAEEKTVSWEEADKHVGEEVTVEGRVLGIHCSQLSCLLAFEPTFNRFTVVVQAASFKALPPAELERRFTGRRVRVKGTIVEREKKPEIIVADPAALVLAEPEKSQEEQAAERTLTAQADALERMADALERIEEITERLVDVQERMDALLANLEQRQAALAAAQVASQAPPPPAASGFATEPPPRAAYESMRTVKRGMSLADVERLMGQPQYVEQGNRWTTWYYGAGRSVSFDGRGRVAAVVGFPR